MNTLKIFACLCIALQSSLILSNTTITRTIQDEYITYTQADIVVKFNTVSKQYSATCIDSKGKRVTLKHPHKHYKNIAREWKRINLKQQLNK